MKRLVACLAAALISSAATAWVIIVLLAPTPRPSVSWDAFRADVAEGKVDSIRIRDREYEFHERDKGIQRATGEPPTLALVRGLRPTGDRPPPKILFEEP